MADMNQNRQRRPSKGGMHIVWLIIELIIVLVIVYSVGKWILNTVSVVNISAPTTITLTQAGSVFALNGTEYSITLLPNASAVTPQVEILKQPAFLTPAQIVTLDLANSTKVNTTGAFANLEITLKSVSNSSISITLTPLSPSLSLAPDSSKIAYVDTALKFINVGGSSGTSSSGGSTTSATTTIAGATTTVAATTTISQAQSNYSIALGLLQKSIYYPLMVNYTKIYANTQNCTSTLYNNTYTAHYGHQPSGQNTFVNLSGFVPYQMTLSITNSTPSMWSAIYNTASISSFSTGPALVININTTKELIINTTTEGVFYELNYTTVKSSYNAAVSYNNACGIDDASATP